MRYLLLDAAFLSVVAVVAVVAVMRARRRGTPGRVAPILVAGAVLLIATAVFDNILIALHIVAYDRAAISGIFVGLAPVEDFAYALAAVVLLPAVWSLLPEPKATASRGRPE